MSEQCLGITKSGNRCKITRNLTDGYCRLHHDQYDTNVKPDPGPNEKPPPFTDPGPVEQPDFFDRSESSCMLKVLGLVAMVAALLYFVVRPKRRK
jgi:hypothetical protein